MTDRDALIALSHRVADAIGRRDADALRAVLAPRFVHRPAAAPPCRVAVDEPA